MGNEREGLLADLAGYLTLDDLACRALPPAAYVSPEFHDRELAAIFRREWLCVGREEQVPERGDYFTFQLLDDPIIVVRGGDGRLRALANVCRHRFMPVAAGSGNSRTFICPYHRWVYGDDGALLAAPLMEGSRAFEPVQCRLPEYRLETFLGFIFVNLDDDAPPLAPRWEGGRRLLDNYRVERLITSVPYSATWAGNWKFAAENSMEYYHHMGLHRESLEAILPARGAYVCPPPADGSYTHERCPYAPGARTAGDPMSIVDLAGYDFTAEEANTSYMIYFFPAFTMAMGPDGNNWLSFLPDGPERTRVLGGWLVPPELRTLAPARAALRDKLLMEVNEEDSRATIELAKAVKSSKAGRGPLGPIEGTVAQFYRYLARRLVS